tara:strand:+ start:2024 stop:2974 length:951 start_codon:yes stop_codon:yes gene_type:complete
MVFLICLFFLLPVSAQAQSPEQQLMRLSHSIREAETRSLEIDEQLQKLRDKEQNLFNKIMEYRYETAKAYHSLKLIENSPDRNLFLLPERSYTDHVYNQRKSETLRDILLSRIAIQTSTLLEIQQKQNQIKDYIQRRDSLTMAVDGSLSQLKNINASRAVSDNFQNTINRLKEESRSLDDFMNSLLQLPTPIMTDETPLQFSLPVSGVITNEPTGIRINAASRALVTTPERGLVIFAGEFLPLGKLVIINHGEGYISILQNLDEIYVQEGFQLQANEPVGVLPEKNRDKTGNNTMLYYELRYNNSIINPIDKITGL